MPPFVGVAVNVTFVPEQIVVAFAAMVTEGVTGAVTVIVIAFEVAVVCVTQAREVVIATVTTSLLLSVVLWNVALLVPAFVPFTFH